MLLSLTTTFAAIDWGMSLAPHWFSTIYGVLFIVAWTLGALSFTIVVMAWLAARPPFDRRARSRRRPRPRQAAARLHDAVGLRQLLAVPDRLVGQHQRGDALLRAAAPGRLAADRDRAPRLPLRAAVRAAAVAVAQAQRPRARRGRLADARDAARGPLLADRPRPRRPRRPGARGSRPLAGPHGRDRARRPVALPLRAAGAAAAAAARRTSPRSQKLLAAPLASAEAH